MISMPSQEISPAMRALLPMDAPAVLRMEAVLAELMPGEILTDDADQPTWVMLFETVFGTMYPGGQFDKALLAELVEQFRATSAEVLYGFWDGRDAYQDLLPEPEYDGWVLEFTDRPPHKRLDTYLQNIPEGIELRQFDRDLFEQAEDYEANVMFYGSANKAFEHFLGFCLVRDGNVLSEASAGSAVNGVIEMGTATREAHRRKGYATIVCAALIQECEKQGYQTYWNCAKQNAASAALARKLGYRAEREYRLFAWFKAG